MLLLNWLQLDLSSKDWNEAILGLKAPIHIRSLLTKLIVSLLRSGNWEERRDVVSLFEPYHIYQANDKFALPVFDSQGVRPASWQIANIQNIENFQNPNQGSFQILHLDVEGQKEQRAAGITSASPIHFTLPESSTDQEMLAAEIVERYFSRLKQELLEAIEVGCFHGQILDEMVLVGTPDVLNEKARALIKELFNRQDERVFSLTSDTILDWIKSKGWLNDYDHGTAIFTLNLCLKDMGYHDLQENWWVTSEQFDSLQRTIRRYIDVPRIRSRATILDDDLDTVPLTEEYAQQASDLTEEVFTAVETSPGEWRPSADPVDLGYLKFLHLMEGYLPLSRQVSREFPPERDIQLVDIQIVNGEPIKFLLRRDMGILQANDKEAFRVKLTQELNIWAGTRLWIRYLSPNHYRISPKFLAAPRKIKAKMLNWDRQSSRLEIELFDLEMQYEGDEHLYKSELRLTDLEALWAEAEERGLSILDCVKEVFPQLARLDPHGRVYYKDLYNAVFFGYRMCSPHTIPALLHQYECFVKAEDGYYTFDPTKGNRQRVVHRRPRPRTAARAVKASGQATSDIWELLKGIVGRSFVTLGQQKPFDLLEVREKDLLIRTSTGKLRSIDRSRIEEAWDHLKHTGTITRTDIRDNFSEFNPAYIISLISALPGVETESTSPIRLSFGLDTQISDGAQQVEDEEQESHSTPRTRQPIPDIWEMFWVNNEIRNRVSGWIETYLHEPYSIDNPIPGIDREISLYLRTNAHQRIRSLLTEDLISIMSERDFNDNIFKFGFIHDSQGHDIKLKEFPIEFVTNWNKLIQAMLRPNVSEIFAHDVSEYLQERGITTTGNQTWGSASRIWAPQIKAAPTIRLELLQKTLLNLIDAGQIAAVRLQKVLAEPNGFGINLSSGILHILYPEDEILYNERSIDALRKFGLPWVDDWRSIDAYQGYCNFCLHLRDTFGFRSLTDVDYFIYDVSINLFSPQRLLESSLPIFPVPDVDLAIGQEQKEDGRTFSREESTPEAALPLPIEHLAEQPEITSPQTSLISALEEPTEEPQQAIELEDTTSQELEVKVLSYIERTRKGQFVMPGVISAGPLFDQPPTSGISPETDKKTPLKTSKQISAQRDLPMDQMQLKTLFSRHYLDSRLPLQPEWLEDPTPVFEPLRELWRKAIDNGDNWNEAQTEQEFIKPVLEVLGWSYIVQAKAGRGGKITRPDYALFADDVTKTSAYSLQGSDDAFYGRSLAIAEAKHWGRALSQKDTSGRSTWKAESNPSHQMVSYLVGTHCAWGILTNGNLWRLYSREVSSTASEYYEVDIADIFGFLSESSELSGTQIEQFKLWWLFFRRDAFIPDSSGKTFLQRVHEGSTTYAREVSDKLKELVFDEVMPEIASGFVAFRREQLGIRDETPESLAEIYRASLSLLYKLLFLLYAEARSLLPMDNPDYQANSLTSIAAWAATQIDQQRKLSQATSAAPRYESLLALFWRVNDGDPALGIPHYNGGLFSPLTPENHFLKNHKLSDRSVARVVDLLVRDQGEPVDYAYISVRNLGAIYEGLLENKLTLVPAPTGLKAILINDKGERKATGSYYTPDYVVEYIVKNTLDPVLEARQADYEKAMGQVTTLRQKLANTADPATNRLLQGQLEGAERQAREAFLGIKVLDPAMGSGHFLVNAVDHLTDGIIDHMQTYHDAHPEARMEWDPIQQLIERVRAQILEEMASQGLSLDARRLDDTALLTRLVMKRCIYGVDLNQMAVELAKLSLWLHTFTVGAPLSFLDHHLRWGNSLIGTDVRTVEHEIAAKKVERPISETAKKRARARQETAREVAVGIQNSLFVGPFAGLLDLTSVMTEVAERADATLADVKQSAQDFSEFQQLLKPYKQVLDLWVSQYFGNQDAYGFLTLHGANVLPVLRGEQPVEEKHNQAIELARRLYQEKRFFHWDLEFPEVFIDLRKRDWAGDGGFDAVVGNPPYVDINIDQYYKHQFQCHSTRNLYSLMLERSVLKISSSSSIGMIVPLSIVCSDRMGVLRNWLLKEINNIKVANFGIRPAKIFPNVDQRVTIILGIKHKGEGNLLMSTRLNHWLPGEEKDLLNNLSFINITDARKDLGWPKLGDEIGQEILFKLFNRQTTISTYYGSEWTDYYHGIGRYWLKAYDFMPSYIKADGTPGRSSTLFEISFQSKEIGKIVIGLLNSSLFFWYWVLYGDDFHLMRSLISSFPFTISSSGMELIYSKIGNYVDLLMDDYKKHSIIKRGQYAKGIISWQEFYPRKSKGLIDKIDDLLGMVYGLTPKEVDYIKNFDIKFRVDNDLNDVDDEGHQ